MHATCYYKFLIKGEAERVHHFFYYLLQYIRGKRSLIHHNTQNIY